MLKKIMAASMLVWSSGMLGYLSYEKLTKPPIHETTMQERVGAIFNKILLNTGQAVDITLNLVKDDEINAWTDGKTLTVTTGIVNLIGNDDNALALVIGHEMAHATLKHMEITDQVMDQRTKEALADKLGEWYMLRAGYDACDGRTVFIKMRGEFGDDPNQDHPDFAYRLDQLTMPWCKKV